VTVRNIKLDYAPRDWQRRVHENKARFKVLALHRRAGKTELALMRLIHHALKSKDPLPVYAYCAPFLKQAKVIFWARAKEKLDEARIAGVCEYSESDLTITFKHNGATIRVFGSDNPDALRGVRLDGVVLDEVAQIRPEVWEDIVQPALSDRKGWAMFIGTPSGINLFSELFYRAADLPDWWAARFTVYDTQALEAAEVTRLQSTMSEASFAREYLCDFTAAGTDQLVSLLDAEMASKREFPATDINLAPKVLGIDPARFGDDRSVFCRRQGLIVHGFDTYRGLDNMELASRAANLIENWQPDAVFIDSGAGAGLIDRLRQLRYDVIEVPFGGKANQPNLYANRRTEMWVNMAEWLKAGAIPNDPVLKSELATPIYWFDAQGRKVLEAKDEIKKRLQGGASPDLADALALTFASPVKAKTMEQMLYGIDPSKARRREHDPYSAL